MNERRGGQAPPAVRTAYLSDPGPLAGPVRTEAYQSIFIPAVKRAL